MEQAYLKMLELDEFSAVREQLNEIAGGIWSADLLSKEHGDVEEWIHGKTTELGRRLLQCHLDKRKEDEPVREGVKGMDGVERGEIKRVRKRDLMSLFGEVQVSRHSYSKPGKDSLFPLDAELNLPQQKYSHGLLHRGIEEVIKGSFDESVAAIGKTTGGKIPKLQLEEATAEIAQDFVAFYKEQKADSPEATEDPLVISLDGKGIVMREEGLREATRKAAQKDKHKKKARLSQGEKGNRKRMATAAAVYSVERHVRSPESIMGLEDKSEEKKKPKGRNKRVWASVKREATEVTEEVFQEALRRDPTNNRPWIAVVDGQPQQLKNIEAGIKRHQVNVTLVLDFIHVLGYLWEAAHSFGFKDDIAESWVHGRALRILLGKASDVAAGMRRSATLRRISTKTREAIDHCADYLLKYTHMTKYHEYLAEGFPIASGVIEGTCRYLIKDRMDITGARWGLDGAEAVLKLRSLDKSGDLDAYWQFHKAKSRERVHLSQYAPMLMAA